MKGKFKTYLWIQIKRVGKLIPSVLLVTMLLLVSVYLLGTMIIDMDSSGEHRQRVNVGIVGDTSDSYLNLGVYALQNMDSSRFSINFEWIELSEAETLLKTGKINAYVCIPDGFVESVGQGENKKITYVTTDGAVGIGSIMVDEVIDSVSDLLLESQNAVYGMQRYITDHAIQANIWDAANDMCDRYLAKVLDRDELYELETVGVSGELSFIGYYVCGISVLFLLLWGISSSPLFVNKDISLCRVLEAKGQRAWMQVAAEYIAYLVLMLISLSCVGAVAAVAMKFIGYTIPEWEYAGISNVIEFMFSMLPVAAMISALQFFLYELVSGTINSILLQFLSAVCLGYLSGCFYPINFFPESIQKLSKVLPTGAGLNYLGKCLTSEKAFAEFAVIILYLFVFWGLAIIVRKKKVR